jgi:hypothetical protein
MSNGLHYLRVGGRGFCLGAGKARRQPVLDGQSREKCLPQVLQTPTHQVHVLLGADALNNMLFLTNQFFSHNSENFQNSHLLLLLGIFHLFLSL